MSITQQAMRRRTRAVNERLGFKTGRVFKKKTAKSITGGFSKVAKTAQKR